MTDKAAEGTSRRTWISRVLMVTGLVGGYGMFAALLGRFLYPSKGPAKGWMLVAPEGSIGEGQAIHYQAPSGARVVITRRGRTGTEADFLALSSTCPHLGCQVHWEPHNNRFFCPCHNGVFTPEGQAVEGPPAQENQELPRYPLQIENGNLFIEVPKEELVEAGGRGGLADPPPLRGPGHDPCLDCRRSRS